ncbi:hypothetical protein DZF97_18065, partial [Clavibacter nebraskensis]
MRDDAGVGGGRSAWHARSVTDPTPADLVAVRPWGVLGERIRAGLARVGIRTDAGRDAAAAAA